MSFVGFRCWYKPSLDDWHFIIILLLLAWHQSQRQGGPLLEKNKFNPSKNSKFNHQGYPWTKKPTLKTAYLSRMLFMECFSIAVYR